MNKFKLTIALMSVVCAQQVSVHSQKMAIEQAETFMAAGEYKQAIPLLEKLSTFKNSDAWQFQLGYCYLKTNYIEKADSTFSAIRNVPLSDYYWQFGEVKQRMASYPEALVLFEKYKANHTNDDGISAKIASCRYAMEYTNKSSWNIHPNPSFLNGIYTGGCYYNDQLWMGFDDANQDDKTEGDELYSSASNTYFTEYISNHQLLSSKYYIGGIAFSKPTGEVVYSIQDSEVLLTTDKKLHKHGISKTYLNTLNLFMGIYDGKDLKAIEQFPFNSKEYSCMHPAISNSGNVCYFSSDMPGGYGGFDIYKMEKVNNAWSKPVNMGGLINTNGNEMYPYELNDSVLYFSSNGLVGYGGADLFKSNIYNHTIAAPVNMGLPANSSADDFGINFTSRNTGYFFSNRASAPGTDGLFTFDFPIEVDYDTTNGKIVDAWTQQPLSDVKIIIKGRDSIPTLLATDAKGEFNFNNMHPNETYTITAQKEKYHDATMDVVSNNNGTLNIEMEMDPVIALNAIFTLHNILFEYNQYSLTRESMLILDKVARVMVSNPNAVFQLSAHTDARGSYADNMVLSQHRAESTVYYLLSKGVNVKQLSPVGFGEKFLKNTCDSDSHCSEEEHAINRRVEIKVVSMGSATTMK
jgi:outer membrane protein OmpA-like peptidoglycan-associated protein/tetratricopeptide (TPR) repeat protein